MVYTKDKMAPHFPLMDHLNAYDTALNDINMYEWPEVRELLNTDKAYDAITALVGYAKATWGLKDAEGQEFTLPRRRLNERMTQEEHHSEKVRIDRMLRDQNDLKNQFRRKLEEMLGNEWIDEPLSEEDVTGYIRSLDFGEE
jgi:hypothetical protein